MPANCENVVSPEREMLNDKLCRALVVKARALAPGWGCKADC